MKHKFYKKLFVTVICIFSVIALGVLLKLFVIGEPVDGVQIYSTASVNGRSLELQIASVESGVALRGWKFKQDGSTLIVCARKVLVSPLFDKGDYKTTIDLDAIDKILFGGQVIWPNNDYTAYL